MKRPKPIPTFKTLEEKALALREQARIEHTYKALEKVKGICKDDLPHASTTINQVLYGERGAWKGVNAK